MHAKTFAILAALVILAGILDLIRRQKMTFRFSLLWLGGAALVLFLAINDSLLARISRRAGFELTSNFIFFLFLCFFIVICLLLTLYINEQTTRSERLAQTLGILDFKIRELEKKSGAEGRK